MGTKRSIDTDYQARIVNYQACSAKYAKYVQMPVLFISSQQIFCSDGSSCSMLYRISLVNFCVNKTRVKKKSLNKMVVIKLVLAWKYKSRKCIHFVAKRIQNSKGQDIQFVFLCLCLYSRDKLSSVTQGSQLLLIKNTVRQISTTIAQTVMLGYHRT